MNRWALLLFTLAAIGTAGVVVTFSLARRRRAGDLEQIPEIIQDCFDRIDRIEREIHRFRPSHEPVG